MKNSFDTRPRVSDMKIESTGLHTFIFRALDIAVDTFYAE
jgi:hypothetical protein